MDIIEAFSEFKLYKDMPIEDWNNIYSIYYNSFFKNRIYPRFFQSYLYLKSERRYFFYGFINDCFVIVKKYKQFKNNIFYLVLPPIHINGDLNKEASLIESLFKAGIKTKLSEEDIKLYSFSKKEVRKEKDNIEHIYNSSDYKDLTLPIFKKFRYNYKKLIFNNCRKNLNININNKLNNDNIKNIDILLKNWNAYKKMQSDKCHLYFNDNEMNTYFEIISSSNNIITSSINEYVYNNKIIITTNYSDYNYQLNDLQSNKALHCLIMNHWEGKSPNNLINSGSAGWDKGLYIHKKQLLPCKELQLFDTIIKGKLTDSQYESTCKG